MLLKVKDNGIGIKASQNKKDKNHKSMAMQITKSRIANFKNKYKNHIRFEIKNIKNINLEKSGVEVFFDLPKVYLSYLA